MRLLLDEHYPPALAELLTASGVDAMHLRDLGLQGASDEAVLEAATAGERALVTNNVRHFVPITRRWEAEGRTDAGLVFTRDSSLPRSASGVGALAQALEALMAERGPRRLAGLTAWLQRPG